ncbi:MAG TPA: GGDEF domain-containing protein [Noviherbaspirillum sp.]
MDAITAGIALIVVQLCVALVMAGIFYAAPAERCTRDWALSGVLVATGVLMVVLNAGAPRYLILVLGNNALICGLVMQWSGIRAFYRKGNGIAGWCVAAAFFAIYLVLLVEGAPLQARSLLSATTILSILVLNTYEVWTGRGRHRSFVRRLILFALLLMVVSYSFRVLGTVTRASEIFPNSNSPLSVTLLYFAPIVGTLLFSNGLLLLYFERVVADKHHLATHDELTGLLNRRAINSGGDREVRLATRLKLPVAIAFVDIDHFKHINDTQGHEAGDTVLVELAQVLGEACRNVDLVGRYGGEEFCLIFPGTGRANAEVVARRLVDAVRMRAFSIGREVTVSVGVASLEPEEEDRSWSALVRKADRALYAAKDAGRDTFRAAA